MMRKFILPLILVFLLLPAVTCASSIIHLENGGQLVTPLYWEEGDEIKFFIMGGIVGVEKKAVRKIEKSPLVPDDYQYETAPQRARPEAEPEKAAKTLTPSPEGKGEDPRFLEEFNQLKARFPKINDMATEELRAFDKDVRAYRNKILNDRLNRRIYNKQLQETSDMVLKIADILQARGHQ